MMSQTHYRKKKSLNTGIIMSGHMQQNWRIHLTLLDQGWIDNAPYGLLILECDTEENNTAILQRNGTR